MSDSDSDHTPVKPRRPQPKPRRFIKPVVSRGNSNLTSESTSSSQLSPQGTQEEQTSNEVKPTDDDFFCRAFTFRNSSSIVLEEEEEKEEKEEFGQLKSHTTKISVKEQQFETTELKVRRNLLVVTDSDDEVTFLDNVTEVKKRGNAIEEFERELSLTPPPEIVKPASKRRNTNDDDLLFLKEIPKTEVDGPLSTESFDTELDPELISVAQRAQQRGQVTKKDVYNAKVEVIVRTLVDTRTVTPQNMKKNARAHAPVKFVMRCNDTFERMMTIFSKTKNIAQDSLVMTYEGVRVFPRATPLSLGIYGSGEIEACTRELYDHLQEKKILERSQLDSEIVEASNTQSESVCSDGTEQTDLEEAIHVKIRSKDGSVEKLKVKPTTTVRAIIQQYIKLKQLPSNSTVRILFDDEALVPDDMIQETEIEDGDMLTASVH